MEYLLRRLRELPMNQTLTIASLRGPWSMSYLRVLAMRVSRRCWTFSSPFEISWRCCRSSSRIEKATLLDGEALDQEQAESAPLDALSVVVGAVTERGAIVRWRRGSDRVPPLRGGSKLQLFLWGWRRFVIERALLRVRTALTGRRHSPAGQLEQFYRYGEQNRPRGGRLWKRPAQRGAARRVGQTKSGLLALQMLEAAMPPSAPMRKA
jgi:hypothetical protein